MQDIRLVGNDGEYLNLETQEGDKFRLVLDDALRSAVKRDSSVQLDSVSISPREIQDAVRAGATAEEVSAQHGVPIDYVQKFALTVVDEIGHIIASAKAVRISVEADRYSEAMQIEFGEVITDRIHQSGGKEIDWTASKHDGLPWQVTVSFQGTEGDVAAVWSFDQRKLILSPENEAAVKFSSGGATATTSTPKLRPIEPIEAETLTPVTVMPSVTSTAPVSSIEELTRASVAEVAQVVDETPLSGTADLLEALRKKRAAAEVSPPTNTTEVIAVIEEPVSVVEAEPEISAPIEEVPAEPIAPAAKKGRPSMPSWDEIVFGTKTED